MDWYEVEKAMKEWIDLVERVKDLEKEEQKAFEVYQEKRRQWDAAR